MGSAGEEIHWGNIHTVSENPQGFGRWRGLRPGLSFVEVPSLGNGQASIRCVAPGLLPPGRRQRESVTVLEPCQDDSLTGS